MNINDKSTTILLLYGFENIQLKNHRQQPYYGGFIYAYIYVEKQNYCESLSLELP